MSAGSADGHTGIIPPLDHLDHSTSDALALVVERSDLRDIVADLYPDSGARPGPGKQRIKAVWRGGDNPEVVSLSTKTLHDFKTGDSWNAWRFLTEAAGYSDQDAAHYLLDRAGLADAPPARREAARREKVATAQQARRAEYLKSQLAEAHHQQRTGSTTGASGYLERKGVAAIFETHEVAGGTGPDGAELPGMTYGRDRHGAFVQLAVRTLDGAVVAYQRIYGTKVLPGDRDKHFIGPVGGAFVLFAPQGVQLPGTSEGMARRLEQGYELTICEGVATGASIALARPRAFVFCALSAGNIAPVVEALRKRYGYRRRLGKKQKALDVCIWADADPVGQQKAHAAALAHHCAVRTPELKKGDSGTDFNDMHVASGLSAVRRTPKTTPNTRLAFAEELGKQHLSSTKHMTPFDLPGYNEALIVRAPMESGKTHQLERVVAEALAAGLRPLVVTNRQSLNENLAARLKLESYQDYAAADLRHVNRGLVVTFDSLWKLGLGGQLPGYDILIIDEVEQALRHTAAEHIGHKAESFAALKHYFADAPRFIGLDAHAGQLTTYALKRFAPNKTVRWHRHDHHIGAGRTAQLVFDRDDVVVALEQSTVPTWYTTDSLRHTRDVAAYLDDPKALTINSETSGSDAVRAYFADPTGTASSYRRLIASPSIQTGVSDDSHHWPHVVGSFNGTIGTPQDAAQSLLRARGAGKLTVHANPARRAFKTQGDLLREIGEADRAEDELRGTPNSATYDPDYLALKTRVLEHESRERANFKHALTRELTLLGYDVDVDLPRDLSAAELSRRRERRDAMREAGMKRYVADRVAAVRIDADKAAELRSKHRLTQAEKFSMDAYDVRAFYRLPDEAPDAALAELLELDVYGKLREQVRKYEAFLEPEAVTRARAERRLEGDVPMRGDRKHPLLRREFYRRLGEVVGLTPETEDAVLDEWEARRAELAAEVAGLETERETATTRRKGQLDGQLAQLGRTLKAHQTAVLPTTYAAGDDRVKAFTAWVRGHRDALSHLGLVQRGVPIDPGYIVARIGGWLRGAGLKQRRGRGRNTSYAVTLSSVSVMRDLSRPRRDNWQLSHFLPIKGLGIQKVLPMPETPCSTAITPTWRNAKPDVLIGELLAAGRLAPFGERKVQIIRSKVQENDESWLHTLAHSRELNRVLDAR